ncbi:hypothetical protein FEM48_Zijuj08G0192400 [Ziziphus jujuba var. spinosa]|uniref:Uncharacterized protein n=1 Tax=Ziziphus jujuba var. spinosa TaxID=714518 RepID=A0A978V0W2_ZIZJJ|nr:hypothetical protein FEM48_Zijuj08G0192400 [Ziziphus jujuba var. spinosa]
MIEYGGSWLYEKQQIEESSDLQVCRKVEQLQETYELGEFDKLLDTSKSQSKASTEKFYLLRNQFPLLSRLDEAYSQLPAFHDAMPEKQPDAPSSSTS